MKSIIQRIATGPELSKDITRAEAQEGMRLVLEGGVDPVQAAIFLIALRLKRETDEEVEGILDALLAATHRVLAQVDEVVDIADPYDGCNRCLPAAPFLPALLAACGQPAVCHGVAAMGPKFGITHRQALAAAGARVDLDTDSAAARLGDPAIGWSYVDQAAFCPTLHALARLRTQMIKRTALTTVENLLGPVRGRKRTHLVTGFVHKAYPRVYALLARRAGFDSALIVRGVEGGVIPSLRSEGSAFRWVKRDGGDEQSVAFTPEQLGFAGPLAPAAIAGRGEDAGAEGSALAALDVAVAARSAAAAGVAALEGAPGAMRDSLVSAAALVLWHLGRHATLADAAGAVRQALDSGAARARLR